MLNSLPSNEQASFYRSAFSQQADFTQSTFKEEVDFSTAKIDDILAPDDSKISFLNIKSIRNINLQLSLKGAQIEKINFTNTNITSSPNRETFTVLKNVTIKQNDQISALDFYEKEMFTYYRELKWSKKFSKKFILFIERYVSKYGTSYVQAGLWIFAFNFLLAFFSNFGVFGIFELLAKAITDPAWKDAIIQISIQTINNMNIFNRAVFEDKPNFRNVIQFFRLVGNGFLYYELIKSFRMFSRKL